MEYVYEWNKPQWMNTPVPLRSLYCERKWKYDIDLPHPQSLY